MQTLPMTADNTRLTGGIQTPLLTEDQLEPGIFIVGNTAQFIWKVEVVDRHEGVVLMRKQPEVSPNIGHHHEFTIHRNTTCACGLMRQRIQATPDELAPNPDAHAPRGLLPLRANTPRAYLIRPREALVMPDVFTVYLTATGAVVRINAGGLWSQLLPLIPTLYPVWSLPEVLRGRLR